MTEQVTAGLWDEFERMLAARDTAIAERDAALAARDTALVERESRSSEQIRAEPPAIAMSNYHMDIRATLVIDMLKWRQRQLLSTIPEISYQ